MPNAFAHERERDRTMRIDRHQRRWDTADLAGFGVVCRSLRLDGWPSVAEAA